MPYSSDSFSAGEQPTTAKWNKLWTNDASFYDGSGIGTNAIKAASLDTSAITLGYASTTTSFPTSSSSPVQVTGLTVSVTIPSGGRRIKITAFADSTYNDTAQRYTIMSIWDGTVGSGTKLATSTNQVATSTGNQQIAAIAIAVVTPSAGSKTYNVGLNTNGGAGNSTLNAISGSPAFILVEAI